MSFGDSGLRVVRRSYGGRGCRRRPGEIVDIDRMRTARELESENFLGPLPDGCQPVVVEDGRTFVSAEAAIAAGYEVAVEPAGADSETVAVPVTV